MIHIHAEIAPVGTHDVLRELRHFHGAEHLVHRIASETQEVGEVLLHVFRVGLSRDAERIVARLVELGAEIKKVLDRLAAAGDKALHFVHEFLHGAGERRVDVRLSVGRGGDDTEVVRNHVPRDIQPELLARFAAAAGILFAAPFADLVQRGLKLKAPPAEARSAAARKVMPLDKKRLFAALRHPAGRRETAVARADDYGIVFLHGLVLLTYFRACPFVVLPRDFTYKNIYRAVRSSSAAGRFHRFTKIRRLTFAYIAGKLGMNKRGISTCIYRRKPLWATARSPRFR